MTDERYGQVFNEFTVRLTEAELAEGWHFCNEFDGLLVGPGMGEAECCHCQPFCKIINLREQDAPTGE